MSKSQPKRGRNWVFVIYPGDSLPEGEPFKTLDEEKVPYFLSPVHDKDMNADETQKKPHQHLIVMFEGNKSEAQMNALAEKFGCPRPKMVQNLRSMARYLCHLDNPEKAQYLVEDVKQGYGADYSKIINLTENVYIVIAEMMDFIADNDIRYYSDLLEYARTHNDVWFRALIDKCRENVYRYIYSRATKLEKEEEKLTPEEQKAAERYYMDYVKYPPKHSPIPPSSKDEETE